MFEYPLVSLQYKCNTSVIWTDTEFDRSQIVCGFSAGEYVSCQVRAFTSAGSGEPSDPESAKTLCVGRFKEYNLCLITKNIVKDSNLQPNLLVANVLTSINRYKSICFFGSRLESIGHFILISESSTDVLEIPDDAYTTLSQNLIGCSTQAQHSF